MSGAQANAALELVRYEQTRGLSPASDSRPSSFDFTRAEVTSDRVWIVKVHMLAGKVARYRLAEAEQHIANTQVARYYARHKGEFVMPEKRDVAVIETYTKANGELARREIEAGKSLLSVVERRDEESAVGGFKRELSRRGLPHPYEMDYFKAPLHVLVGPIKSEIYYLFEVTRIVPARQQGLAEVQALIRQKLVAGPRRVVHTNIIHALDRSWRAKTRCRAAYLTAQCGATLA